MPAPAPPGGAVARLLEALAARGHATSVVTHDAAAQETPGIVLLSDGFSEPALEAALAVAARSRVRLLVVGRLGVHPDARVPALRRLWDLEERARATGPTLALRLAPMLGPASPLWARFVSGPSLPRGGRQLLQPVAEEDVVETLDRALRDDGRWPGWYEVAGVEVWSLAELSTLARGIGGRRGVAVAWEPPLAELETHRLVEPEPWIARFGVVPGPLAARAGRWGGHDARSAA